MQADRLRHRPLAADQDRLCLRPQSGRILAAIGYAGVADLDVDRVRVWLGSHGEETLVAENGGCAALYREEDGARIMKAAEITVRVDLGAARPAARSIAAIFLTITSRSTPNTELTIQLPHS